MEQKDVRGEMKGHAGDGSAGDNSATVSVHHACRPEHSRAEDAVAGDSGMRAAAGEAA